MVSKVIEKVVHNQLNAFLSLNNLYEPFQSAYRPYHSCETALLRISDDILQSLDRRQCVAMLFLDLSAAFDTVDHSILLNRLRYKFGVSGSALQWFKSYLSNRHQFLREFFVLTHTISTQHKIGKIVR
ncbi:putative RNA-directed DNA polymerase from transposon BS [Exaiptasia diaphana]|nr:putative RNA-directed DNA polymerase from transposon BS [Exaiptasia diaphana]